jgi:hypothetical protein
MKTYLKITKAKLAGSVTPIVENLLSKYEALSSNSNSAKLICFLYKNEYRIFKPVEITRRKGLG